MSYIQKFNKFVEAEAVKKEETKTKKVTETVAPPPTNLQNSSQLKSQYDKIQALTTQIGKVKNDLSKLETDLQNAESAYVKAVSSAQQTAVPTAQPQTTQTTQTAQTQPLTTPV
jgi:hypothetical protein